MPSGLGKGLDSLIPKSPQNKKGVASDKGVPDIADVTTKEERENVTTLEIDSIKIKDFQPRKEFSEQPLEELSESIKNYGVIQPLIVSGIEGKYELIAGERRLRAAQKAGLKEIPVIIRDYDSQKQLEIALIENIQREDLSPIEEALAYKKLIDDFNMTVREVAKKVGKSRPAVSNVMRLLELPEEVQESVLKGQLKERQALWIAGLDTEAKQMEMFRKVLHDSMSTNDIKEEVKKMGGTKQARIKQDPRDKNREDRLREALGTKVKIERKKKGGSVTIDFYSDEELDGIVDRLG